MKRIAIVAIILWIAVGLRLGYTHWIHPRPVPEMTAQSLREYPRDLLGTEWDVRFLPMAERIEEISGVADYTYLEMEHDGRFYTFYVGFVSGGVGEGIHHPEVCFPNQGLIPVERDRTIVEVPAAGFTETPRFLEMYWKSDEVGRVYSLSSFCYHGKIDPDSSALKWADVHPGLASYSGVLLFGAPRSNDAETRAFYTEILTKLLAPLPAHLPRS